MTERHPATSAACARALTTLHEGLETRIVTAQNVQNGCVFRFKQSRIFPKNSLTKSADHVATIDYVIRRLNELSAGLESWLRPP
jgi:hypothetical protein